MYVVKIIMQKYVLSYECGYTFEPDFKNWAKAILLIFIYFLGHGF